MASGNCRQTHTCCALHRLIYLFPQYLDGLEVIGQSLEKEQEPNNNIIEQIDIASESSDLDDLEEEFP